MRRHRPLLPIVLTLLCATHGLLPGNDDYQAVADSNQRPMLGVEMTPVPSHVQDKEGLTPSQGVYVQNTYPDTAASAMGLKPGDVILDVNRLPITSMQDLRNEVGLNAIGDPIEIGVVRDGRVMQLSSKLRSWPDNIPYEKLDSESERRFREFQERRLQGQSEELRRLTEELARARQAVEAGQDPDRMGGPGAADGEKPGAFSLPPFRFRYLAALRGRSGAALALGQVGTDPYFENPTGTGAPWRLTLHVPSK